MFTKEVDIITFKLMKFIKEQYNVCISEYADKDSSFSEVDKHVLLGKSKAFIDCINKYNELIDFKENTNGES